MDEIHIRCGCGSQVIGRELNGCSYWACEAGCFRSEMCFKCGLALTGDDNKRVGSGRVGLEHATCPPPTTRRHFKKATDG